MGTKIEYTALYGDTSNGPVAGLLRVNDFTLLLDCGWDDQYDTALLKPIVDVLDNVDALLLSHPDASHLGALPYLIGSLKLQAPIYATTPVHKMGQMFLYDQFLSRQQSSDFEVFTLDDVDSAFQRIRQLKYQQQVKLTGRGQGISLTAFAAGHLIGGAIWQILTPDEEQIVYAVHWNHRKDRHLKRADLDGRFSRPALLITDACSTLSEPCDVAKRDADFLAAVTDTLKADGNVLIPCDTAGRVLELMLLVEQHWQRHNLRFGAVFLTPVAFSTLEFAKSQLEWMNQDISETFNRTRSNPFSFRHIKVCHSKDALWELAPGPKLVLASLPSLAAGAALQLLVDWAPNPLTLVAFPGPPPEGSAAAALVGAPREGREAVQMQMALGRRVPLDGEELQLWQAQRQAQLLETQPLPLEEPPGPSLALPSEELELGEGAEPSGGQVSSSLPAAELLKSQVRETLIDGFQVPEGAAEPMFPFLEDAKEEWTEYGFALKPGEFQKVRGEEDALEAGSEEEEAEEIPTRVVSSEVVVNVRARVSSWNFQGLSDGHSIRTVLANIAPRHLIATHGTSQAREALAAVCSAQQGVRWQVHCAEIGRPVDASSGSSSYRVSLSDDLLQSLSFRNLGAYKLAWLNAAINEKADPMELPELVPTQNLAASSQEGGIFVGDVKLSALKKALGEQGISADFAAGALVCRKRLVVRAKSGGGDGGHLCLEGPLCSDYYKIRDVIYSLYHIC